MYSSGDGEGPIAVLTPVEVEDEEPQPELGLAVPGGVEPEPVEPELELSGELPQALQSRGFLDYFTGRRISAKIVVPFIVVMFVLAIGGSYVVLNLITTSLVQRFENQLLDAGKNVNDGVIKTEGAQLELLRLMTNTEGVDAAVAAGDAPALQKLLVPLQANSRFNYVDVVDPNGKQVLALRPNDADPGQALDPDIGNWDITRKSLSGETDTFGNKWTELVTSSFGPMVYTAGPIKNDDGKVIGAVLVGIPFDELVKQLTRDVAAAVSIYTTQGEVFGSSLKMEGDARLNLDQDTQSKIFGADPQTVRRTINVGGQGYIELLGGLVVRDKVAGGLGVAIPSNSIDKSGQKTRTQLTLMFTLVTLIVLCIGLIQARRISNPIVHLVAACRKVGGGDLDTKVDVKTKDETGILAHNFNQMIAGLRERDKIRDAFGRYMTEQVSDAILKGDIKLGGETRELTMLMSDIRGFTTLSETMDPEQLVGFLNRYFAKMIDCVMRHDGVVDKFMGDAILVVYGAPVKDPEHPMKAVLTAIDMRQELVKFNEELISDGHVPIRIGIGVNTGDAVTGNIGSESRMEYTVIGDTVNATQRTEDLTKEFKTDILVSEPTAARLDGRFILGEPHHITLRGRHQESLIFPVIGVRTSADATELWSDQGPVVLGQTAPTAAQDFADLALQALQEGKELEVSGIDAETLVKHSLKSLAEDEKEEVEVVKKAGEEDSAAEVWSDEEDGEQPNGASPDGAAAADTKPAPSKSE